MTRVSDFNARNPGHQLDPVDPFVCELCERHRDECACDDVDPTDLLVFGNRRFRNTDAAHAAIQELEWATAVLSRANVTYPNGRESHEAANAAVDAAEDTLLDFEVFVPEVAR